MVPGIRCIVNGVVVRKGNNSKKPQIWIEDVSGEMNFWSTAVYGYILGARPPWTVVNGFLKRVWSRFDIDKISFMTNGIFLVRFKTKEHQKKALDYGPLMFDSKPVIIKEWLPDYCLVKHDVKQIPIWVKIHDLDIKFWGARCLRKIIAPLGKFLKCDANTSNRNFPSFPRLFMEVELNQEFPKVIEFLDESAKEQTVRLDYEWLPITCVVVQLSPSVVTPIPPSPPPGRLKSTMPTPARVFAWADIYGFPECCFTEVHKEVGCHKGGKIWMMWNPSLFTINVFDITSQTNFSEVTDNVRGFKFKLTVVYGFNKLADRKDMWNSIIKYAHWGTGRWMVHEDFNNVMYPDERIVGTRVFSRIDRLLHNDDSLIEYPDSVANFLPEGLYDHSPCIISMREQHNLVQNVWHQKMPGTLMYQMVMKLKNLKRPLKRLNTEGFQNIEHTFKVAEKALFCIQEELNRNPTDVTLNENEKVASQEVQNLLKAKQMFLSKKANLQWVLEGEDNSAYFHSVIKKRRSTSKVFQIKDMKGVLHSDPAGVAKAFELYYIDLLGTAQVVEKVQDSLVSVGNVIQGAHIPLLLKPITGKEIKDVMFYILGGKAAGPDGFSSQANNTILTLIPKVELSSHVSQFRPIACCNMVYKCITNVLSSRLSLVLPDLGRRGLRQGDPMSPLLFTLCMEYLSRIICVAQKIQGYKYHSLCKKSKFSHMCFADDLLLFCHGNLTSVDILLNSFEVFSKASGLKMNVGKSNVYMNGVDSTLQAELIARTGMQLAKLPFRIFLLPKRVLKQINDICRNFLWQGHGTYEKSPPVAWSKVCKAKEFGGLGILNSELWNIAAICKYVWWIANKKDHMWVKWDGYSWLQNDQAKVQWQALVWTRYGMSKNNVSAWLAAQDRLLTRDRLCRRGVCLKPSCLLCENANESHSHLFFECWYSRCCLQLVSNWLGIHIPWQLTIQWWTKCKFCPLLKKHIVGAAICVLIYQIWQARNVSLHDQYMKRPGAILQAVKYVVCNRINCIVSSEVKEKHSALIRGFMS
ncbi:uncharacterized protein LOC141617073 [Silene latifolia]|uniref:uncharacterized protein LOC141617073 n=1 Tax=Silene latifolia TaxID=37657 RepID=UPI003D776B10